MNTSLLTIKPTWQTVTLVLATALLLACTANQPAAPAQSKAATTQPEVATTQPEATPAQPAADAAASPTKFNLNTATEEDFLTIPNMGDRMVREFFEYRPYVSIQQFRQEIGKYVDEAQVAEYEQYVFVPIAPNDADEATLQQIPGVDATVSAGLVAARPFAAPADFLNKLMELAPTADQALAQSYLVAE